MPKISLDTIYGVCLGTYLGSLHTQDWEPVTNKLQALSLVEKAESVQVRFTLCLRDQRSMWMQDGCKVSMDSYMASNGSRFMVTWSIFQNHLLEVGLTQNRETTTLWTLTTVDAFYLIMCEDPREQKFIEIAFGWGPSHIWLHTTLEGPWPHYMIFGGCVGTAFGHFHLGSHNFTVTAFGSCVKWPFLLHTARLLQLLNVEHQIGALIDQSNESHWKPKLWLLNPV